MQNKYTIVPMTDEFLKPAAELLINYYKNEQKKSPLLPSRVITDAEWIHESLKDVLVNPGVAIVEQNQLVGYMLTAIQFQFKGQQAVLVPEYCHSAVEENKREIYQRMYMHLSQEWSNNHTHLQMIGHFAHDTVLQDTLYQIGFGAILAERLRDLSPLNLQSGYEIKEEKDVRNLLNLEIEHHSYYSNAPIFIVKSTKPQKVLDDLLASVEEGDTFFVYYEDDIPCAYMIVGSSAIGGEGFLLQNTNTAQIKSAYASQKSRGMGIGKALLQKAIEWSNAHGYERIFVEHETANFYGGKFWNEHFSPYLYYSMRYIDTAI